MKKPKHILARDDRGTQVVILEIELAGADAERNAPSYRYELANRSPVTRISDREFIVVPTGVVLCRTGSG